MSKCVQSNLPLALERTGALKKDDAGTIDVDSKRNIIKSGYTNDYNLKVIWQRVILFCLFHLGAVYGIYLMITSAKIYTLIFGKYKIYLKIS